MLSVEKTHTGYNPRVENHLCDVTLLNLKYVYEIQNTILLQRIIISIKMLLCSVFLYDFARLTFSAAPSVWEQLISKALVRYEIVT